MSIQVILILLALAGAAGIGLGYFLRVIISLGKRGSMELQIRKMMLDAEERAKAKEAQMTHELKERASELKQVEERLVRKEELLDKRQANLDGEQASIERKNEEIRAAKEKVEGLARAQQEELEKAAHLSAEEAKKNLIASVEKRYEADLEGRMRKLEISGNERLEQRAKEILTTAVHRLGNSVVSDVLATTISLPNDEIKGKIIGKEGRNIRAFERATGVDVIVDDTPGTITLSSYDPIRRQIARIA